MHLTYHENDGNNVADRPKEEIEITDEMVDAGLAAYADFDSRYERTSTLIVSIYRAMAVVATK